MPYVIPASGFEQSLDELAQMLSQYGDVHLQRDGSTDIRVSFVVEAPGYGEQLEAVFEYCEWFHPTTQGWLRQRYRFEYRPNGSRKAYHHGHSGGWGTHQHCEPPGRRSGNHYADYERVLQQAAEEFGRLYARPTPISCFGLRRLDTRDTRTDTEVDAS